MPSKENLEKICSCGSECFVGKFVTLLKEKKPFIAFSNHCLKWRKLTIILTFLQILPIVDFNFNNSNRLENQ